MVTWQIERDALSGQIRRYIANPKVGCECRITLVYVGENPTPQFHFAAQCGTLQTSGTVGDLETAQEAALTALSLLNNKYFHNLK